jgi:hypothetical protein
MIPKARFIVVLIISNGPVSEKGNEKSKLALDRCWEVRQGQEK